MKSIRNGLIFALLTLTTLVSGGVVQWRLAHPAVAKLPPPLNPAALSVEGVKLGQTRAQVERLHGEPTFQRDGIDVWQHRRLWVRFDESNEVTFVRGGSLELLGKKYWQEGTPEQVWFDRLGKVEPAQGPSESGQSAFYTYSYQSQCRLTISARSEGRLWNSVPRAMKFTLAKRLPLSPPGSTFPYEAFGHIVSR